MAEVISFRRPAPPEVAKPMDRPCEELEAPEISMVVKDKNAFVIPEPDGECLDG